MKVQYRIDKGRVTKKGFVSYDISGEDYTNFNKVHSLFMSMVLIPSEYIILIMDILSDDNKVIGSMELLTRFKGNE